MKSRIVIKNYRCFAAPAEIDLDSKSTAFVGVNNAGKSAILRFLLEFRNLFQHTTNINTLVQLLHRQHPVNLGLLHVRDSEESFSNLNDNGIEIAFEFESQDETIEKSASGQAVELFPTKVILLIERNTLRISMRIFSGTREIITEGCRHLQNYQFLIEGQYAIDLKHLASYSAILSNTLYFGPFRNIINVGANASYFDIQIGDVFVKQFRDLKTGPSKRNSVGIQRLIEDIRKLFEFDTLSIEPSADNTSLHVTVNNYPYKHEELGSGLSQFIVVLANAAIRKPALILIDEPELNLHPRLQYDFLTTLSSYASYGVWFSTHSIGLARASSTRLYSVHKQSEGNSTVGDFEGTPRMSEFLGEMSFSTYKELGFDKILLVEGPTERKVFQSILRQLRKDHQILIAPMHGHFPNTEELEEVLRISTDVAALFDSERASEGAPIEKKRQDFLDICAAKNLKAHALNYRATENYFPDSVVKEVFGASYIALAPYQRRTDVRPMWSKQDNWKLAAAWPIEEVLKTDLGQFLNDL